ncbi:MAG: ATP-binding protein [Muribaculum sp.]|nr:ATP-binding protein [Muribaculum sp.]
MNSKALYYDKFLEVFIDYYRQTIKQAKPGHCMKVTGFAMKELKRLISPLRSINPDVRVFILSDEETGENFIHATKLIEYRNDGSKPLLVLIPVNSRTSAEDSYGDATFKELAIDEGLKARFRHSLVAGIPEDMKTTWDAIVNLIDRYEYTDEQYVNYLLFMEQRGWEAKAWGEGLFCVGLLPDSKLLTDHNASPLKRFLHNIRCSDILCNFSLSNTDKAQMLPVAPDTIQKDVVDFFMKESVLSDRFSIFEKIYESYPNLYFSEWDIPDLTHPTQNIIVWSQLMPGKDAAKELVKNVDGDYVLQIKPGKKGKVKVKMSFSASTSEVPELQRYQILLMTTDGYVVRDELRNGKLNISGKSKTITLNIPYSSYEDGNYFIRIHALDANGVQLDNENPFASESVEAQWQEYLAGFNPQPTPEKISAMKEQFQQDHNVLFSNDTTFFTIKNVAADDDDIVETNIDKRKKVNNLEQAYFNFRIELLRKGEELSLPEVSSNTAWKEGSLNDVFAFDFGNAISAYQIQNSRKLLEIERLFYKHSSEFGSVYAEISGNPTETKLQDKSFIGLPSSIEVPSRLKEMRRNLFSKIENSAASEKGVLSIFPIHLYIEEIREYVREYSEWINSAIEGDLNEAQAIALQNIDIADLQVEMPDGQRKIVKIIPPLHPIRLAWFVNIFDLYRDWEEKTEENPDMKKQWYKKLDKLFMGEIPLEVSSLVLTDGPMKIFQYVGELTFGWGMYSIPIDKKEDIFGSEFRQLKSYVTSLLNITRDKQIDSDVNLDLVYRHIENYSRTHIYADKLVINLFNAGDANVFADALVAMERHNEHKNYEIRLFADDTLIQPGQALRDLLDPDSTQSEAAESFAVASANRLFPKLRFSVNSIQDFLNEPRKFQAHLSFLINPFPVKTEMVRPSELAKSFFLNGVIIKSAVSYAQQGEAKIWSRYFAENPIINPSNEFANESIVLFGRLEYLIGKILSSSSTQSVPATCLSIFDRDAMMLSFIHQVSDWVVTFDKNLGPEFYDLPLGDSSEKPYLLDYIPGQERTGISSFLTTLPTSEIEGIIKPQFEKFGITVNPDKFAEILEDVRAVSSSMVMQTQATQNKAFEVVGMTLTKRLLMKKGLLKDSFIIPIDLHKELFEDLDSQKKERADSIVVSIDTENKVINMMVVEVKCRQSLGDAEEEALEEKMIGQVNNTIEAMEEHFGNSTSIYKSSDRLDKELTTMELNNLLSFYIKRAQRYGLLSQDVSEEYLHFLNNLNSDDFEIDYKRLGIIFNLGQNKKQIKTPYGDATIYKMGRPVIEDILSSDKSLETCHLDAEDVEFINEFPKSKRREDLTPHFEPTPKTEERQQIEDDDIPSVNFSERTLEHEPERDMSNVVPKSKGDEAIANQETQTTPDMPTESRVQSGTEVGQNDNKPLESPKPEPQKPQSVPVMHGPEYGLFIGAEQGTSQYGILGETVANKKKIALDLNGCNTISLFGVQGAGKSYTIGVVTEMMLKQFENVNKLPSPLASVIFHYSETMDYAPEFTSMIYPNDAAGQLAKLKEVYGVNPDKIEDVILLTTESKLDERKAEYPNLEVYPIGFDSKELQVQDWMFLLGAVGNDSVYIKEFKQILKKTRHDLSLKNIKNGLKGNSFLSNSQKDRAMQRIQFAEDYIQDGTKLQQYLKPGRLVIVDLRDEFIEKEEALGLFVVMLNIFSGVKTVDGQAFNKFIVFDEAHKYMDDKKLVEAITTAIREMRHKGVSIMIASQDPVKLAPEIIELSSVIMLHRFNSPAWVSHMKKAVTALGNLSASEMASLGSGEAYLWATKASDKMVTTRPIKISIRPRVTKHGGDTIQASNS